MQTLHQDMELIPTHIITKCFKPNFYKTIRTTQLHCYHQEAEFCIPIGLKTRAVIT